MFLFRVPLRRSSSRFKNSFKFLAPHHTCCDPSTRCPMTTRTRFLIFSVVLFAVGCHTCDDRPHLFGRLRDRFDRDEREPLRERLEDRYRDRSANAVRPATEVCAPCATGTPIYNGTMMSSGASIPMSGMPAGWSSGPTLGTPIMPSGSGTVLPPPRTYNPRDNELPLPGSYSQPNPADMGFSAPKPQNNLTGR